MYLSLTCRTALSIDAWTSVGATVSIVSAIPFKINFLKGFIGVESPRLILMFQLKHDVSKWAEHNDGVVAESLFGFQPGRCLCTVLIQLCYFFWYSRSTSGCCFYNLRCSQLLLRSICHLCVLCLRLFFFQWLLDHSIFLVIFLSEQAERVHQLKSQYSFNAA